MGYQNPELPDPDLSLFDEGPNDEERCGLIFQRDDGIYWVHEVPNRAERPKRFFRINKSDLQHIDTEDVCVGVVHTHPFRAMRMASQKDVDSIPDGLVGMVYHPSTKSIVWYDSDGVIEDNLRKRR